MKPFQDSDSIKSRTILHKRIFLDLRQVSSLDKEKGVPKDRAS